MATSKNSNDEVAKAQEAAAARANDAADNDGSGGEDTAPPTIFDKILSGEWSSTRVYEDDDVYAFEDVHPQAPVHVIVIPKRRDGLTQLSRARLDQGGMLGHLLYVAQDIGKTRCPNGFRIVINDGKDGSQSVYHLHLHVLGGRQMNWPPG